MKQNKQKYISFIIIILVIALGVFLLVKGKNSNSPAPNTNVELSDDMNTETDKTEVKPSVDNTPSNLTKEQKDLLAKLQKAVDARDFESFALLLEEVYKNEWSGINEFKKLESELYVYATNTYWVKGDLENSLKVSTLVFSKVPEAWRFRYLRIVTLEKYGRNAFDAGDLNVAENYATKILSMMYRPEGANLLADIYIKKIETNLTAGDKKSALKNLNYIWDFEVSQDRRDKLIDLKKQVSKL